MYLGLGGRLGGTLDYKLHFTPPRHAESVPVFQMERTGAKSTPPAPAFEPSRKKGKSGEPHAVMSVAAMELNEAIVEGPSRPSRTERHHRHERHEKSEEKRGRSRDYDDGEHERKKQERSRHGKKRRHD